MFLVASVVMLVLKQSAAAVIVPDDFSTVQAAIDSIPAGATGTVSVRPGTYPEALVIHDKSVTLEGLGGRPMLAPGATADGLRMTDRLFAANVTVMNVDIVGARRGILAKIETLRLEGIAVIGCKSGGIIKARTFDLLASTITGSTKGSALKATAKGPRVEDNAVTFNARGGIKVKNVLKGGFSSISVERNIVTDNGANGLTIVDKAMAFVRDNDTSRNGRSGLILKAKGEVPAISGNQSNDNGKFGFDISGGGAASITEPDLLAAGNVATGNGEGDFR